MEKQREKEKADPENKEKRENQGPHTIGNSDHSKSREGRQAERGGLEETTGMIKREIPSKRIG